MLNKLINEKTNMGFLYKTIQNPYCIFFIISYIGFLTMSFIGIENKTFRIISTCIIILLSFKSLSQSSSKIYDEPIIQNFILYIILCFPSLFFTSDIITCSFKLIELVLMAIFTIVGISNFNITNKFTIFKFTLSYYILHTSITMIGYLFDPKAIAVDTGFGSYVTFLRCNYPPIHANGLSAFGIIAGYYSLTLFINKWKKNHQIKAIIPYVAFFILSVYMIYLTSSRTGIISGCIGLIFLAVKILNKYQKKITVCFGIILAILFSQQIIETTIHIMMKKQDEKSLEKSENIANTISSGRLEIWETILANPADCILGKGFGTAVKEEKIGIGTNAHNSIVELLISVGIFATFFWIRLWYLLFKRYFWLCKYKYLLPCHIIWYHLATAILIISIIRSIGNLSFIYFDLACFAPIAIIALFVYSTFYVKQRKRKILIRKKYLRSF